ncbi:uncharacterized protein F4807DRAFT_426984 [Annulohypoxylon truncatum]|uniref:uncharacterized protein n=1 Tax=Annulohypoxylon truncatum TaxID=327061 RepID=UPI002007E457|nr:uncharacterized protein F4807DRAFT_426984 [Annulohypoxylon truncatum]KAI1209519.1 hypothetical protein F4807DRAFT_426984 [Annulohypoxylon truncatum]
MDPADLAPRSEAEKFLNDSYDERWEKLRDVIVRLYLGKYGSNGKSMTIRQVAEFMKSHYNFYAVVNQYQTRFRKWDVRRRILSSEKDEIVNHLGKRKHPGTSTSDVKLNHGEREKPLDTKQLKRYAKDAIHRYKVEAMVPRALSSWNLPYAAYAASLPQYPDEPSPFGTAGTTPNYLNIDSPEAVTPGGRAAGPSPNMQLIRQKATQTRSSLFLQGRYKDLLINCGREDRIQLINYLHDFHIHTFVTAKYWGKGPRAWTAEMIAALTLNGLSVFNPATPVALSPVGSPMSGISPSISHNKPERIEAPTMLCRWSIHVPNIQYMAIKEPETSAQDEFILNDPSSWPQWRETELSNHSLPKSMLQSITTNAFTTSPSQDLPISMELVEQSLSKQPETLVAEAWKFAIMAGNAELLYQLGEQDKPREIDEIYPFHLAAAFLDGGHGCCTVIDELAYSLGGDHVFKHNINDLGHTILDSLMVSILRSHTKVKPEKVSIGFSSPNRYPGEERDICGRWDADTPAVRKLFQHGHPRIPGPWKHPFCHTSVQAICHSVIGIFGSPLSPDINTLSGLFLRRCSCCGLELKLGPLHTLVIVAYYLAHRGMRGETMFGPLAILVCLLRLGADASLSVTMSVEDIIGEGDPETCYHKKLDACDLMQEISQGEINRWPMDCQIGWSCILHTLYLAKRGKIRKKQEFERNFGQWVHQTPEEESDEEPEEAADTGSEHNRCTLETDTGYKGVHGIWLKLPCGNPELGLLWATIQVELLTYRRVTDNAPWVSDNFSMGALKIWLTGESDDFSIPLVETKMMKEHSPCGWFPNSDFVCPIAQDVCEGYFMNMDIYDRASMIERASFTDSWAEIYVDRDDSP